MIERIKAMVNGLQSELSVIRRHLHSNPELSFQEFETAEYVESILTKIGIADFTRMAETGVVALIRGRRPERKCVALRADLDALPIQEENDLSYKSKNAGIMHACGHDVHTACLLGAASVLYDLRKEFEGTVKLIFQPGEEESPGGASLMIKGGVLENPVPAAIFALHVDPGLPSGQLGFKPGQYMASSDEIHITVHGKGGHAALPHTTIDPIAITALIITALQQVVSRRSNPIMPTVLSFGSIHGGKTNNVIPDKVTLSGTLRTFNEEWRKEARTLIRTTAENIAAAYGALAEVSFPPGYPSLYNNPSLTEKAMANAERYLGEEHIGLLDLRMTAEDFSFYAQKADACFFRLGTNANNEKFKSSVHTSTFDIDESALPIGAGVMCWLALGELSAS